MQCEICATVTAQWVVVLFCSLEISVKFCCYNYGTRADEVNTSLKRSYLWPHITKCDLKTNIKIVSSSKGNREFSIDLLQIGNGANYFITLNNPCDLVKNVE